MAWSYRRRLKLIPGVFLNFSKSGISTSIGPRGAKLTIGKSGVYANVGIPGTGIYNRQKISGKNNVSPIVPVDNLVEVNIPEANGIETPIVSTDVLNVTSQSMIGVKEAINSAKEQRDLIKTDINEINNNIFLNRFKCTFLYIVYPLAKNKIIEIKDCVKSQKETIIELNKQLEQSYVKFDIEFDPEIFEKYKALIASFKIIMNSNRIWDITSYKGVDAIRERSWATSLVKRIDVKFGLNTLAEIKTDHETLFMKNANGGDLYFYSNFIIMYSSNKKFGIIDFQELTITYNSLNFVETERVPLDSEVLFYTWNKVNKDGTRDKRFKDNYQIPVVKYGCIKITSNKGVNEEYQISNNESALVFVNAFNQYKKAISPI